MIGEIKEIFALDNLLIPELLSYYLIYIPPVFFGRG